MISLSVSDAVRHFPDLLQKLRDDGEWVLLTDHGKPVVRMLPAGNAPKGSELALVWADCPHMGADEAECFEADVTASRRKISVPASPWD